MNKAAVIRDLDRSKELTLPFFDAEPGFLRRTYAPGKWCAQEILGHLTDSEIVFQTRARFILLVPRLGCGHESRDAQHAPLGPARRDPGRHPVARAVRLMSTPGVRPYLWMVCGTFNFATMSALSRSLALQNSDWRLLALARAGLMLAFAVPIALATRSRLTLRGSPTLWLRSIVGSLGLLCTFYTLSHLHISESITLLNMYPIWVSLLSWIVFKEVPALKV